MKETGDFGSFIKENKQVVKEWIEAKMGVYKLKLIRIFSKSAGYFIWIIVSMFLAFLFIIFAGLTAGFWFSHLMGSYAKGFGLVTLILVVVILLIATLRKVLFVNPIIRNVIRRAGEETLNENTGS